MDELMLASCSEYFDISSINDFSDRNKRVLARECFHAVGHALMYSNENDVFEALFQCDKLPHEWMKDSCYYGAFMEQVFLYYSDYHPRLSRPFVDDGTMVQPMELDLALLEPTIRHDHYSVIWLKKDFMKIAWVNKEMRKKILFIFIIVFIVGIILIALYISQTKKNSEGLMSFSCPDCNVILISIDTLGAKHLGLYGGIRNTSPFLDTIAAERGIVFENAIAQASWTLPSHTAMLTGQYPADLGMWTPNDALPTEAKTIAEALQENGYQTQAFSNGSFIQPEWGFDQGFDSFSGNLAFKYWNDASQIFDEASEWLRASQNERFFLFIHSYHAHSPFTPTLESLKSLGILN